MIGGDEFPVRRMRNGFGVALTFAKPFTLSLTKLSDVIMSAITSKILLQILLLTPAALFAPPQKRSPEQHTGLIKNVSAAVQVQGCGCYFQFPNEARSSNQYLFFEDFSEESPLMNVGGKDVRLKLISSSEPAGGATKRGQRFSVYFGDCEQ